MLFYKGFRYSEVFQKILLASQKIFGSLPAVRTTVPFHLDAHLSTIPSVQTTCHTIRTPDRASIIRSGDVDFRLDPSLHREASVPVCIRPTSQQPVRTPLSIRPSFRFFPFLVMGRLMQPSGRLGFPFGRASP